MFFVGVHEQMFSGKMFEFLHFPVLTLFIHFNLLYINKLLSLLYYNNILCYWLLLLL